MKELDRIADLKHKLREAQEKLNSGQFIEDALIALPEAERRKAVSRYLEAREQLLFAQEQYTDEIEAHKPLIKDAMIKNDLTSLEDQGVYITVRRRTTYKGSDAESALRDNGLLDEALSSGALTYPPTLNTKSLTPEMKEAIECVAKVSHSITIK